MVMYAFNFVTQETEAGGPLHVEDQTVLHSEF